MLFHKVFAYCFRCTIMLILTNSLMNCCVVVGQSTKMAFNENNDVEIVKVTNGDSSEPMIGSASDIDRKYSSRVKLFDDIFNIPISVLQQVNNLLQGIVGHPGQTIMAASGYGRSLDMKQEGDSKA
ncbi:hypothetical protein Bhyg_06225 [Pseudolycoriella hygida]|uniref:Uncharacterized protein n=1 Tax=Pseudolycoriella hygida TaxID=35572 RepID=A0A9Q0N276_9DIPT|nr:hypothetical protein Bhyg_06225 [Pseudolycoriella hygida]